MTGLGKVLRVDWVEYEETIGNKVMRTAGSTWHLNMEEFNKYWSKVSELRNSHRGRVLIEPFYEPREVEVDEFMYEVLEEKGTLESYSLKRKVGSLR